MKTTLNTNKNEINMTSKMPTKKSPESITLFWTITVIANALLGATVFLSGSHNNLSGIAGMFAAIITCIAIYSAIEIHLRNKNQHQLVLELRISACIRIFLQPVTDFFIGAIAVHITSTLMKNFAKLLHSKNTSFSGDLPTSFISTYLTTMTHALFATVLVACILGIVKMLISLYKFSRQETLENINDPR